jgi:hypothetical protein
MPREPIVELEGAFCNVMTPDNERRETFKDGPDFKNNLDLLAASIERMAEKINFQV